MKAYKLPRGFLLIISIMIVLMIGGGFWFFITQRNQIQRNVENELLTIAESKVNQISQWRSDQIAEGNELVSSDFFVQGIARWMQSRDAEDEAMFLSRFQSLQDHYGYFDVLLVNPEGKVLISLKNSLIEIDDKAKGTLHQALESNDSELTDLHTGAGEKEPHISVVAPLITYSDGAKHAIGSCNLNQ